MGIVSRTKDALLPPVVVRCLTSFATMDAGYKPGSFYRMARGEADSLAKSGLVRVVIDAAELAEAEQHIAHKLELV